MKLAHVNLYFNEHVGVVKKLHHEAKAAKEAGLNIDFMVIQPHHEFVKENIRFIKMNLPKKKFLEKIIKTFFRYQLLNDHINLEKYDKIILRNIVPAQPFHGQFFNRYPNKIISEHHTNELSEMRNNIRSLRGIMGYCLEKLFASLILSKVQGIIAVDNDVKRFQDQKTNNKKPSIVITNGISVQDTTFTKFVPFDGKELTLIFVASVFSPWQGLDRILRGLQSYSGATSIKFYIIGEIIDKRDLALIEKNDNPKVTIKTFGVVTGERLDSLFQESSIACSVLALYRKSAGNALKTREYIARGIPFIYAYNDPDLDRDCKFALKIDNNNAPVDINHIIKFAKEMASEAKISNQMRNFAINKLDWKHKLHQMYNFAESLEKGSYVKKTNR